MKKSTKKILWGVGLGTLFAGGITAAVVIGKKLGEKKEATKLPEKTTEPPASTQNGNYTSKVAATLPSENAPEYAPYRGGFVTPPLQGEQGASPMPTPSPTWDPNTQSWV